MNKQNIVHPRNGILFSNKTEWSADTRISREHTKWKESHKKITYDSIFMKRPKQANPGTENRLAVAWGRERGSHGGRSRGKCGVTGVWRVPPRAGENVLRWMVVAVQLRACEQPLKLHSVSHTACELHLIKVYKKEYICIWKYSVFTIFLKMMRNTFYI